jgi:hypothetical protein
MIIRTPLTNVKDQLITFISEGFGILGWAFNNLQDNTGVQNLYQTWANRVANYLLETFPTPKEFGQFKFMPGKGLHYVSMHPNVQDAVNSTDRQVRILESIDSVY